MLTIRDSQLAALAVDARRRFLDEAVEIVRECWPRKYRIAGPKATRALVERAIADAAAYGIEDARDVLRYVNVVMAHGADFARDARFGEAAALLERTDVAPAAKIERLSEAALAALERRAGRSA